MSNSKSNKPKVVCPECGKSFINLKSHQTKTHADYTLERVSPTHLKLWKSNSTGKFLYLQFIGGSWGTCGFQSNIYSDWHTDNTELGDSVLLLESDKTIQEKPRAILVKGSKSGVQGVCKSETILVGNIRWI